MALYKCAFNLHLYLIFYNIQLADNMNVDKCVLFATEVLVQGFDS